MKKILFYTSGVGLGGVEAILLNILNFLNKDLFDIKLGLQHANENLFESEIPNDIDYRYMLPIDKIKKILEIKKKKKNIFYKLYYSFLLKKERKIIKKNYLEFSKDRDIIIDFKSSDYARLTLLNDNKKKICWYHTSIKASNAYKKNPEKLRKNLNKYHKIVVICDEMKKQLIGEFPELENKIERIYNPFDFEKIRLKAKIKDELNEKEKKMLDEKYIIMVARIEIKMKDYTTLLKAYEVFLKTNPDIKLYLLGDGPDRRDVEKLISEKKLSENVVLLGKKMNPYVWIKNAECLIQSSKYEGLPTVLIEAMILNKAVISTNCPTGPKEILEDGKNGVLVDVGDYNGMAQKLNELINNLDLRSLYIKNAQKSIDRFDKKVIKRQIENLFQRAE